MDYTIMELFVRVMDVQTHPAAPRKTRKNTTNAKIIPAGFSAVQRHVKPTPAMPPALPPAPAAPPLLPPAQGN